MQSNTCDEQWLLRLLQQDSEDAFARIFERYHRKVFHTAISFLKSADHAEEIVQEVFLKIWLKRNDASRIQNLDAYLSSMTRNCILDRLKKAAYESDGLRSFTAIQSYSTSNTDHRLRNRQCETWLAAAIRQLPERQQQVYHLARTEGWSHDLIALQLGISRLTVKKHMAEALQSIRRTLQGYISACFLLAFLIP
ncbi:RNA polymerase sigma-70 factor, ECF subfamily [Chitinophaga terrae (ex Kim and Jung 2007)]|uniref:RNA polymerase sigma-70 factor, ECF subfamily n=1 Tax=Chitinophaga terrae (ex Kim and Jung 2007) TaxID=408074 RepID=A0A1H3X8E8_9BACT|nr:sigma-70 family RNA polymerase sigma factor [Chitinophaga terrae (ex Kim and Jung 2007)]GEP89862.1 RNA polymerase sigma-70 factor [Chitinophaga terrae (ex Kim and Jung 2007)]SDZ95667.1 RNA polymerase sigma-70 factor, ECF subfamily [Chitinophaga terrae (ex Kim and Jung 2007)]